MIPFNSGFSALSSSSFQSSPSSPPCPPRRGPGYGPCEASHAAAAAATTLAMELERERGKVSPSLCSLSLSSSLGRSELRGRLYTRGPSPDDGEGPRERRLPCTFHVCTNRFMQIQYSSFPSVPQGRYLNDVRTEGEGGGLVKT